MLLCVWMGAIRYWDVRRAAAGAAGRCVLAPTQALLGKLRYI